MNQSIENPARINAILDFWFDRQTHPTLHFRSAWFAKDLLFDQAIRDHFLADYQLAASGKLASWTLMPDTSLAFILLTDQFPRNMFRGTAQAFATDTLALAAANHVLEAGYDLVLPSLQRMFVYLPFEHSEDLQDQQRAVALFTKLEQDDTAITGTLDYANQHLAIIERFGRFPHRNQALGRSSSPEELAFLSRPGSSF